MAQAPHIPTDENRGRVARLKSYGESNDNICALLGICEETLVKYYGNELKTGLPLANEQVAKSLFYKATVDNDLGAMIFWLKTRARWRDKDPEDQQAKAATQLLIEMLAAEKSKSLK